MAGRAKNRDEDGRKLPWRPPGAEPAKARDLDHAKERARYRHKPDGVQTLSGSEASAQARAIRKLDKEAFPVTKLPARLPNPRLLTDAQLIALVKELEHADTYDWATNARPEQLEPDEYNVWLLNAGRGFGKELLLSTMIPTPSGWTTMGDLHVGAEILDEAGRPCRVTAVTEVETPEISYRLTFSDGAELVACSDHQWVTWTHSERKAYLRAQTVEDKSRFPVEWPAWRLTALVGQHRTPRPTGVGPQIRTTQEVVDTLTFGKRGDTNHCIPTCGPLQLPARDLLLDPYVLGYWLGDGNKNDGTIACHDDDKDELYVALSEFRPHATSDPILVATYGLFGKLKVLDLLGNKHVPGSYLRGSIGQRLDLLRGLMDSDGYCDKVSGHVEFSNTNKKIVDAVFELAVSLGQKPVVTDGEATLYGRVTGPKWRVTWRPTINPFQLKRKADRVRVDGAQSLRNHHRMIVKADRVPSEPMRCIQVDSPNSMYLAGRHMIPTHNTRTGAETVRDWTENQGLKRIAVIAKASRELRNVCFEGVSGLNAVYPKEAISAYRKGLGDTYIELTNGAKIIGYSAEAPDAIRGEAFDAIWGDEYAAWPKHLAQDMYDQAWFCMRESKNPRMILTTTPKRVPHLMDLLERAKIDPKVIVTSGKTTDNTRLSKAALLELYARYAGTHLGRQELGGELLMDVEGALWVPPMLEAAKLPENDPPQFKKVIIGVDPSGSATGDATGIVAIGYTADKRIFVLGCYSTKGLPLHRYSAVCKAVQVHRQSNVPIEVICEYNHGGDNTIFAIENTWKHMVENGEIDATERKPQVKKSTLKGDKAKKAEPLAGLYEQQMNLDISRIWHMPATQANGLDKLENEQLSWAPTDKASPNSLDAFVVAGRRAMQELGLESMLGSPGARRQINDGYRPW